MLLKNHFIKASEEYNTFEKAIPAYYFRRTYVSNQVTSAEITIAVCGFYELFLNGTRITKGLLARIRRGIRTCASICQEI